MLTLNTHTAARFAANLAHIADTAKSAPAMLACVRIAPVGGGVSLASTDRFRLLEYVAEGSAESISETLVPAKSLASELAHLAKVYDSVTIQADGATVKLTYGDGAETVLRAMEGERFPNYAQVKGINGSEPVPTSCLTIAPHVWEAIGKVKLADPKRDTWDLTLNGENGPAVGRAEDSGARVTLALMPRPKAPRP